MLSMKMGGPKRRAMAARAIVWDIGSSGWRMTYELRLAKKIAWHTPRRQVKMLRINTGRFRVLGGVKKRSMLMMRRRMVPRGATMRITAKK